MPVDAEVKQWSEDWDAAGEVEFVPVNLHAPSPCS